MNSTLTADVGTITRAPLTISTSASNKVYDGTTLAAGTLGSLSGVFEDDVVSLQGTAVFNFLTKHVGTELMVTASGLSLMGTDAGNYTFTPQTTTADITPAPLFYVPAATTRLYESNNPVFAGTVSGLVGGDALASVATGSAAFTSPATSATSVGSYAIDGSGLTLIRGDYTLNQAEGSASALTITRAPLTYTSTRVNRTYGSANPVFIGNVTGLVLDQTLASVATGSATFTSTATPASNIGAYAINGSGLTLTSSNYSLEQAAGNASALTITPATLTYTSSAASRTYGSANPTFTGTVTGLVLDQTLASVATGSTTFTSPAGFTSNVGTYAINGSGLTLNTGNYIFEQSASNSSALTIAPARLTYLATSGITRIYGSSNPTFTGSVTGFVNGETIVSATTGSLLFSSPATISSQPGRYAINGSGLTANFGNYIFTQVSGNASALTITAPASPNPTPTPGPAPSPTTLTIAINNSTDLAGQTPSLTAAYTGVALSGINIPALLAGLTYQITPVLNGPGTYTVTASGTAPTGYTLNILPGSLTVVADSPTVLPSQVPVIPTVLPVVLPVPPSMAANLLQPLNSLGLFQVDVTSTGVNAASPFSFSGQGAQPPPLAQFSFFSGANDKKDTYAAGAKP